MKIDCKVGFIREEIDRIKTKYWYLMDKENRR